MITRERLNELIKQGATIYIECWGKTKKLNLNDLEYMEVEDDDVYYEMADNTARTTDLERLFETKEEAEWYKEFGNIVRSEVLDLPTWKEFEEEKFIWFVDKNQNQCCLYYLNIANKIFISVSGEVIEIGEFTKENYILACRKCKELFLGEDDEE